MPSQYVVAFDVNDLCFFFSSRRRHTRYWRDWSSDVCSSDLLAVASKLWRRGAVHTLPLRLLRRRVLGLRGGRGHRLGVGAPHRPASGIRAIGMAATDNFELSRLALQGRLDAAKTAAERNRMGQFATATQLATEVVGSAAALLPPRSDVHFLDPAIGTGAFYSALLRTVPRDRVASAVGYEIDGHYGEDAAALWGDTALRMKIE